MKTRSESRYVEGFEVKIYRIALLIVNVFFFETHHCIQRTKVKFSKHFLTRTTQTWKKAHRVL